MLSGGRIWVYVWVSATHSISSTTKLPISTPQISARTVLTHSSIKLAHSEATMVPTHNTLLFPHQSHQQLQLESQGILLNIHSAQILRNLDNREVVRTFPFTTIIIFLPFLFSFSSSHFSAIPIGSFRNLQYTYCSGHTSSQDSSFPRCTEQCPLKFMSI